MNYFYPLNLLVFGFLLTAVLGLISSWVDRKVTARVQYRVGPPFFQPFIDIVKLLGKETMIPAGASRMVFLTAPVIGLSGVIVASAILWGNQLRPAAGFAGDWIVMLYLLTVPSISIILGGFASGNPLASIGASREMKLVLAYELPFVLAMLVPVLRSDSIRLGDILAYQVLNGATAGTLSGILALVVAVLCMQAKLALVPFDAPFST
jgi:NADH-quinone oxidoreductase subunit H